MELEINFDILWNFLAAPWACNYNYNKRIDKLFAQIDYDQVIFIDSYDYSNNHVQILDQKNHIYIRTWISNSPYAILCQGQVSLNKINDGILVKNRDLIFEWSRGIRPSRYEMGRFIRYMKRETKLTDDESKFCNDTFIIGGTLVKNNGKFFETVEISQEEWEEKYALYLLKNS